MCSKKILTATITLSLMALLGTSAYAAEFVPPVPTSDEAIVSDEVTRSDNQNPSGANTEFFLFIDNPVEATDIPKTGDSGPDMLPLLVGAITAGCGFLACNAYANRKA